MELEDIFQDILTDILNDIEDGNRWNNNQPDCLKLKLVNTVISYASANLFETNEVSDFLASDKVSGVKKSHLDNIVHARARTVLRRAYMVSTGKAIRSSAERASQADLEQQSMANNPKFGRF